MCLDLIGNPKAKIATEDIVCYKFIKKVKRQTIPPDMHGKEFRGVINNIVCEGKISIYGDQMFFCTNNHTLDGSRPHPIKGTTFGFECSWVLDSRVTEVIVDGTPLVLWTDIFVTPYRDVKIDIGETYKSKLLKTNASCYNDLHTKKVDAGLHSFVNLKECQRTAAGFGYGNKVVKCIIPKDSRYYEGEFNGKAGYASNKITYVELLNI